MFAISQITYGGGALVAPDGTIYQCVRNATINNVYAINPNGTQKWAIKLDAAIGAFPALSEYTLFFHPERTPDWRSLHIR